MARLTYHDFDLLIERAQDHYRARVIQSPAGQASAEFALPFTPVEVENLVLRVGRIRKGLRGRDSPQMEAAKQFGGKLFEAVFAGNVRGALRSSLDSTAREGAGLRVRLRFADTPELADVPWEYLYDGSLNWFLALSKKTPLVRYMELPGAPRPLKIAPPLRLLVIVSSPGDYEALDVEREWKNLQDAVHDLTAADLIALERLDTPTLGGLRRKLRQGEFHVLHFIGHGGFDAQTQDGVLILQDEQGRGKRTSGQYLAPVLTDHDSLRLVVLNACEGARTGRADPFAGVAQSLVQAGIPAVIAMQFEVTDEASITFAQEFYAAVADGYPVDAALADARGAIFAQVNDLEWGTPVLYLRAPDGVIFTPLTEQERAAIAQAALAEEQLKKKQQAHVQLAEEQARVAEEKRIAEEQARLAEEKRLKEEEARLAEENRVRQEQERKEVGQPQQAYSSPAPPPGKSTAPSVMPERPAPATAPSTPPGAQTRVEGFPTRYALPIAGAIVIALVLLGSLFALGVLNQQTPTPTTAAGNAPFANQTETASALHFEPSPPFNQIPQPSRAIQQVTGTTTRIISIREGPSSSTRFLHTLKEGEDVKVVGRNADGSWLQVQIPNTSNYGWMSAIFLDISGDLNSVPVVQGAANVGTQTATSLPPTVPPTRVPPTLTRVPRTVLPTSTSVPSITQGMLLTTYEGQQYWVDIAPVTVSQFADFAAATSHLTLAEKQGWAPVYDGEEHRNVDGANWRYPRGPGSVAQPGDPVTNVDWTDARAFCGWSKKHLASPEELSAARSDSRFTASNSYELYDYDIISKTYLERLRSNLITFRCAMSQ